MHTLKTVKLKVKYGTRSEHIKMVLTSPSGTRSILQDLYSTYVITSSEGRTQILTSVHFWDESCVGIWRLDIHSASKNKINFDDYKRTVFINTVP